MQPHAMCILQTYSYPVDCPSNQQCNPCREYQTGYIKPHYPVPTLRHNAGGVLGDWIMIGAWILDWSRGSLEWY